MDFLIAIIPSVGVIFLFVVAIRSMFQADRRERLAQAQIERRERASAPVSAPPVQGETPNPGH